MAKKTKVKKTPTKVTVIFEDKEDGQVAVSMEFDPILESDTRSMAAAMAIRCFEVAETLGKRIES